MTEVAADSTSTGAAGGSAGQAGPGGAAPGAGERGEFAVRSAREVYRGRIMALRVDEVQMPDEQVVVREVVEHLGAVAIVALDEAGQVTLIRQYRHAVGGYLLELPAGLLDVEGEPALATARRELFEEAALRAARWHTLLDLRPSPGMSDEAVRVFLARDLTEVPAEERYVGMHEETDLGAHRVPLDDAVDAALAGEIENAATVAGLLAASRLRAAGWAGLRPPDAPWPARPGH